MDRESDVYFMQEALREATRALEQGEVPVGAVVVCGKKIIARGHNQTETLTDATAHAEMIAMTAAANHLGSKYLTDCALYVTLEPCVMCAGALYWVQLPRLIFGAPDVQRGYSLVTGRVLHPTTEVTSGILAPESTKLLDLFFERIRKT